MEAFPPAPAAAHAINHNTGLGDGHTTAPRRRRKSSTLGGDPRGDTGAGSFATRPPENLTGAQKTDQSTKSHSKRRRARSYFSRWKRMSLKHTWVNPLILLLVLLAAYYISPGEQNPLYPFIHLSYADPPLNERTILPAHIGNVTQYGKGKKDFAFVAFYIIVFTFTREFIMQRIIRPIAIYYGIRARGKQARFMEQFYTAVYFAVFGPYGVWVMSRTPVWYFRTVGMYENFPHRAHEAYFKAYYLLQASYWAQQAVVLVLQLEKPRKDFKELVMHHIVTLTLIGLSYRFHFVYMGIAVYITHDISDFFLATSKVLNYVDAWITPAYFATFIGVWAYLRHYINLKMLYSMLPGGEFQTVGDYTLNWETQQYKCSLALAISFPLLAILQAINLFWFFLIIRILFRLVAKGVQKDERSEDEDEEEEELEAPPTNGHVNKPQVLINGEPVSSLVTKKMAAGMDVKGQNGTPRRRG